MQYILQEHEEYWIYQRLSPKNVYQPKDVQHQALVYNSFILSQGLLFVFATSSTTPLNTFSMIYMQQKQTQGLQDCAQN